MKDFKADILEKYSVEVSMSQCFRAKKRVFGEVEDSLIEHYAKVWDYVGELLRANPGSTVKINVNRFDPTK